MVQIWVCERDPYRDDVVAVETSLRKKINAVVAEPLLKYERLEGHAPAVKCSRVLLRNGKVVQPASELIGLTLRRSDSSIIRVGTI